MTNREIPFRPRIEGEFRVRFYNAVSAITEDMPMLNIVDIANREINWVENICVFNLEQRKKYRAIWFLFRDLVRASWKACYRDGVLYMSLPSLGGAGRNENTSPEVKALLRSWMSESRHERLVSFAEFIKKMEKPNAGKHTIEDLIADGDELAERLLAAKEGRISVSAAVSPYLQLVTENERDAFTGLKISEIWRYFRLTWSTPAETTPGRTMQYLIRDAAHPMHAVMGIASLENCAVQITCRDDYIGWNQKAYIERLLQNNSESVLSELRILLTYLEDGIKGIDYSELCTQATVDNPTDADIKMLLDEALTAEQKRQEFLKESVDADIDIDEKSDLGSISKDVEKALYRRKRADQLARLLSAKKAISDLCNSDNFAQTWQEFCKSETGNSAIRSALVAQKTKHIGSSMMELNVCGAIPPYNEILGGKLVALLATSPQVIHDYKVRYSDKPSEIASRLKGEPVCRPADLVYVGTTSLYYVGSSQYNRLKIPGSVFDCDFDLVWKQLGMTIGFGTLHISKATTLSLSEATSDGYTRINHVFGEGASPKMRLLTMSIRELLESTNEDSKDFSKHAMSRIVYGVSLAENAFDYLLGKADKPSYYTDIDQYQEGTQRTIDFWSNRWLSSRLNYEPIYARIRAFDKKQFLVSRQVNADEEWTFTKLKEEHVMPVSDEKVGLQFVRDFYRGSSGYADYVPTDLLERIHLKTRLDDSIIDSVRSGKDVVLTGNAGDGKTHLIRVLKSRLEALDIPVQIELDASTLSNEEIYDHWKQAKENGCVYIIAINAAVLYGLYHYKPDYAPIRSAYSQLINSIVFHENEQLPVESVVVFDLSKREALTKEILKQAIEKLTDDAHYHECTTCPLHDTCEIHTKRRLLNNDLFQTRLALVFDRVSLKGYHATLREVQGFISYLIFGNRNCQKIQQTSGKHEYDIANLIFSGKGTLFKAICAAFDPVRISHPVWDEKILVNDIDAASWAEGYDVPLEAIAYDNEALFQHRKRQFFFFNQNGQDLLTILDDDVTRFQDFLSMDSKKAVKELIRKLNTFFGMEKPSNSELQIWSGHRFDSEPRKVLISAGSMKQSEFRIGHPSLLSSMQSGIDMTMRYLRLEKKNNPSIFLKVDFDMYLLLAEAERGVPVLFMESDLVKKVWRFIEQLQSVTEIEEDDADVKITLMDVQNKKRIRVSIDRDEKKYTAIDTSREGGNTNG